MRLRSDRLRTPGASGAGLLTSAGPVALALALVGAAWCARAWTRPLASSEAVDAGAPPDAPALAHTPPPVDVRAQRLDALSADNPFDAERAFWERRVAAISEADEPRGEQDAPAGAPTPPLILDPAMTAPTELVLTSEEDLPDDVKQARHNLELRALYQDPSLGPIALMGFKQSSERGRTVPRRAGDAFVDETHNRSAWGVARIDLGRSRVVLVRSGATVAIELYPQGTRPVIATATRPQVVRLEGAPIVESRTRDEIVAELREQGLSEPDILTMLQLMELPSEGLEPAPVASGEQGIPDEELERVRSNAPPGLEGLFEMMQNAGRGEEDG